MPVLVVPAALTALLLLLLLSLRVLYVLRPCPALRRARNAPPPHALILLGSGGHTGEMLLLLSSLESAPASSMNSSSFRRTYMVSAGDHLSAKKALAFEALVTPAGKPAVVHTIPRARRVRQSWLTTPLSCAQCLAGTVAVLVKEGVPDVVLLNGPGAAVVVVAVVMAARVLSLGRGAGRCIYVESFARVTSLSLSGRLLYYVADRFIVQWEALKERWPRAEYYGILV